MSHFQGYLNYLGVRGVCAIGGYSSHSIAVSRYTAPPRQPQIAEIAGHKASKLADCVNFSPPLISREISGIRWNLGKFGEIQGNSGELSGTQWGFVWRLVWIQWEFLGDFGATPDFRENSVFGVVSGDLGGRKAFAQIATLSKGLGYEWAMACKLAGFFPESSGLFGPWESESPKFRKGLEVCYCLWGCHPDPRLGRSWARPGPILGPRGSRPDSPCALFYSISDPSRSRGGGHPGPSWSRAFLPGSGLDGPKQTSWPLPKVNSRLAQEPNWNQKPEPSKPFWGNLQKCPRELQPPLPFFPFFFKCRFWERSDRTKKIKIPRKGSPSSALPFKNLFEIITFFIRKPLNYVTVIVKNSWESLRGIISCTILTKFIGDAPEQFKSRYV